jgi:hypothetical protein
MIGPYSNYVDFMRSYPPSGVWEPLFVMNCWWWMQCIPIALIGGEIGK